jgi:hypothetical protein
VKRNLRRLTVDDEQLRWRVEALDCSHVVLHLWRGGAKQVWARVRCRFDDPWLHYGELLAGGGAGLEAKPLTPARVAALVRALRVAGLAGEFELRGDGALVRVERSKTPGACCADDEAVAAAEASTWLAGAAHDG